LNELASVAIILLFALMAGHLVKFARIPEVTGYILAGIAVGPFGLGWLTHENLKVLDVFSEVALGLILFSIGGVFEASRLRTLGKRVALLTSVESVLTLILVTSGMLLAGHSWAPALLLGAIAVETAAASTLMVIRECNAEGPLTDTLTCLIGINNLFCIFAFTVAGSFIDLAASPASGLAEFASIAIFPLLWQFIGSAALGYLLGLLLTMWAQHVHEHGEILILLAGCVLLSVGASTMLGLSPLIASLSVGATMVNLSDRSRRLFEVLSQTDPPLYAIFFVIAGADLNLALLPALGLSGVMYAVARGAGKLGGVHLASKAVHLEPVVRRLLGPAMLSQAGLAIGLVLVANDRFPAIAPTVTTVVLAAVTIFELIGPVGAKYALVRGGEAKPAGEPAPAI
jgi:Kef-type K+ transport system membrane component KefB